MPKVVALVRGYDGQQVRYQGDRFDWPKGRPLGKWVKELPFGGKGDHDRDGETGGIAPVAPLIAVPADWQSMTVKERKALSEKIDGEKAANVATADAVISAYVEANKPETFGEAPAPETAKPRGTGLQDALGTTQPDWVDPASGVAGGVPPETPTLADE